jgi:hypothetical protein
MNYAISFCIDSLRGFMGECEELLHSFGFLWAELDR